jgi:hypothetical protein
MSLNVENDIFFGFEFLGFLLLLVLLLLEGACVVTPLPTNRTGIEGVGNNETKWGSGISWSI